MRKGHAKHGLHATSIDQTGEYAGENVGRVWIRDLRGAGWRWVGLGNAAAATRLAKKWNGMSHAAALAEYEAM